MFWFVPYISDPVWNFTYVAYQGRIQDFKLGGGGATLKKLRRAEGGAKIFGLFRVKNHDFTPKNHIFFNCRGRRENFWGISCEKSRFYAKKSYFFPILGGGGGGGGGAPGAPLPESAPAYSITSSKPAKNTKGAVLLTHPIW